MLGDYRRWDLRWQNPKLVNKSQTNEFQRDYLAKNRDELYQKKFFARLAKFSSRWLLQRNYRVTNTFIGQGSNCLSVALADKLKNCTGVLQNSQYGVWADNGHDFYKTFLHEKSDYSHLVLLVYLGVEKQ